MLMTERLKNKINKLLVYIHVISQDTQLRKLYGNLAIFISKIALQLLIRLKSSGAIRPT